MNDNQDNLTDKTLVDGAQLTPANGGAAVDESLSLAELNSTLGKTFKDKPTALAALKETQSWVGKKIDAVTPAPDTSALRLEIDSLKEQTFYATHPELKGHEDIIKAMGSNPAEVVEGEAFKKYFEKANVADEVAQTKSVVSSNARISQVQSVRDSAINVANSRGTTGEDVALVFASQINAENNQG